METTIDAAGRIVVPKQLRDALGLEAGTVIDISSYGTGLALIPRGRIARLVEEDGLLVADSDRKITDDDVFSLMNAGRR
ncbi:MAG TPA: AbrB/MazE/SpoVT family DNA-binding domain-containing protein [Acidimicrobiales bacterium]|nr:AbrB/MazE/SpoVT family DNA-binding domain-containing protein [Acidimicrobiales bacterium]